MDKDKKEREYTIEDLEELLNKIPYEVWIKDSEGRNIFINKISAKKMGLEEKDVIGKTDFEFRPKEMAESCMESDKAVLSTGKTSFVEDKILIGNRENWYEIYKTILDGNKNRKLIGGIAKSTQINKYESNGVLGAYLDIASSSQVKDSDMNRHILSTFKSIIEADDLALYLYDSINERMELETHLGTHKVIFAEKYIINEQISNIYLNTNEIKEELSENRVKYIYLIKNKNKLIGSLHIYFENNPIQIQEEIIKYTCIILSFIFENRNLENKLKKELKKRESIQNKLEMLINTGIDIYAIVGREGDEIRWFETNKKCDEIIGWTCEDLNLKYCTDFMHPDDKSKFNLLIKKGYDEVYDFPLRILCKNGQYRNISFNWKCVDENLYIITGKDMTNLYELKKDKKDLEQVIQMESLKMQFFANISHEFKTPLNIILSAVQVILNCSDNYDSKFNKYIKNIKQNSYRLLKLANNMIDISKIDEGFYELHIDNYNIVEVVENIVQSVAEYIKNNNRTIVFDTSEEEILTACDPAQIEKIVLNLLSNSLKFTSCNGNIYVNMNVSYDCSKVIIRIKNDGPPISEEEAERIFNRFTQSENLLTRSVEGTGIGLALVKSLVELHNGRIYVNTQVNIGTEFSIELPIRKILNQKTNYFPKKNLNSKVERFNIEFSDIYDLN